MSSVASIKNLPVPVAPRRPGAVARPQQEQFVAPVKPIAAIAKPLRQDVKPQLIELQADKGKGGRKPSSQAVITQGGGEDFTPPNSGHTSIQFVVQLLGQMPVTPQAANYSPGAQDLAGHRHGSALGSEIYRRAGGEPREFSSDATIFRIAV